MDTVYSLINIIHEILERENVEYVENTYLSEEIAEFILDDFYMTKKREE